MVLPLTKKAPLPGPRGGFNLSTVWKTPVKYVSVPAPPEVEQEMKNGADCAAVCACGARLEFNKGERKTRNA